MSILPQPSTLRLLGRHLLDTLLPGSCLLCNNDSRDGLLCPACLTDLPAPPECACPICGEPTAHGERCGPCLNVAPHFDATFSLFRYDFPVDRIIQALKYRHRLAVAPWLAKGLAEKLTGCSFDTILALPLHRDRLRERGFNQSGEIARRLARRLDTPFDTDSLVRTRPTAPQAELPLKARAGNVRGAFECRADLEGRHLLLVDDVMTSGATLDEAARTLKLHGATRVSVAVAARAFRH